MTTPERNRTRSYPKKERFAPLHPVPVRNPFHPFPGLLITGTALLLFLLLPAPCRADQAGRSLQSVKVRESIFCSAVVTPDLYLMAGDRGKIYLSQDRGDSWNEENSGTRNPLFSASFPDSHRGWICGKSGLILFSGDGGRRWTPQPAPVQKHLFSIDFSDDRHGCAVGDWGAVIVTDNAGDRWSDASLAEDLILYGVRFLDARQGCLVGEFGRIFLTGDGGRTWQEVPSPVEQSLFCLARDGDSLYAAGLDGVIVYSRDRGKSWRAASSGVQGSLYGIAVRGLEGWAAGDAGTVIHTSDAGETWSEADVPPRKRLFWIGTLSLTRGEVLSGFAAGAAGLSFRITAGSVQWEE